MKRYNVKCRKDQTEYIDILNEDEDGFFIRHTRLSDGSERIAEEAISKHLFDLCLKTGHIYEIATDAVEVA
jgi:hypothetical protein